MQKDDTSKIKFYCLLKFYVHVYFFSCNFDITVTFNLILGFISFYISTLLSARVRTAATASSP